MAEPKVKLYRTLAPVGMFEANLVVVDTELDGVDIEAAIRKKLLEPWNEDAIAAHDRAHARAKPAADKHEAG